MSTIFPSASISTRKNGSSMFIVLFSSFRFGLRSERVPIGAYAAFSIMRRPSSRIREWVLCTTSPKMMISIVQTMTIMIDTKRTRSFQIMSMAQTSAFICRSGIG